MNHPEREELTGFLYQELASARQAEVAVHLATCTECRSQVESWQSVRQQLAAWELPRRAKPQPAWRITLAWPFAPAWRFAALAGATATLVLAGFGLARLTAPPPADTVALREAVTQQVREELRAEFTLFSANQAARQQEYQQALTRTLGQLEATRLVDYANLRRDMETVAVRAEDELQSTRQDLVRLASAEMVPGGPGPNR